MFTIVITPVILCRRLGMEAVSDPWLHVRPNFRGDLGDLLEESNGLVLGSSWNLLVLNVVATQDVVSRICEEDPEELHMVDLRPWHL